MSILRDTHDMVDHNTAGQECDFRR